MVQHYGYFDPFDNYPTQGLFERGNEYPYMVGGGVEIVDGAGYDGGPCLALPSSMSYVSIFGSDWVNGVFSVNCYVFDSIPDTQENWLVGTAMGIRGQQNTFRKAMGLRLLADGSVEFYRFMGGDPEPLARSAPGVFPVDTWNKLTFGVELVSEWSGRLRVLIGDREVIHVDGLDIYNTDPDIPWPDAEIFGYATIGVHGGRSGSDMLRVYRDYVFHGDFDNNGIFPILYGPLKVHSLRVSGGAPWYPQPNWTGPWENVVYDDAQVVTWDYWGGVGGVIIFPHEPLVTPDAVASAQIVLKTEHHYDAYPTRQDIRQPVTYWNIPSLSYFHAWWTWMLGPSYTYGWRYPPQHTRYSVIAQLSYANPGWQTPHDWTVAYINELLIGVSVTYPAPYPGPVPWPVVHYGDIVNIDQIVLEVLTGVTAAPTVPRVRGMAQIIGQ